MALQILGGFLKGQKLKVPSESITRPTSIMLRKKIFDAFQNLEDFHFVDLCSGSGAMGLEALSRGAKFVTFIESNRKAFSIVKENAARVAKGYSDSISFYSGDVKKWLEGPGSGVGDEEQCIFFFDPPYAQHQLYEEVAVGILLKKYLDSHIVWIESDRLKGKDQGFWSENCSVEPKIYKHSNSYIAVFRPR